MLMRKQPKNFFLSMNIEKPVPSYPTHSNKRCPYLGLGDDPDTALGFPSNWNVCHGVKPIATPHQEHQQRFCLTAKHITCLAFNAERKSSLPKELRIAKSKISPRAASPWIAVVIVLFFVVLGGLILSGYWTPSWAANLAVPEWIGSAEPEETAMNTSAPIMETETLVESPTLE